jgi:hypothetical protein
LIRAEAMLDEKVEFQAIEMALWAGFFLQCDNKKVSFY